MTSFQEKTTNVDSDLRAVSSGTLIFLYIMVWLSWKLQYNLNGSNTDGSFTVDDSNSFFSPFKILPIAQENKYLGKFSYFIMKLYVVCTH